MRDDLVRASPWDALLRATSVPRRPSVPAGGGVRPGTKLAALLAVLAEHESLTTLSLSVHADLTSNQVWGLLKQPRAIGQVRYADGRWSLADDFLGADVQRAVELLRSKGWYLEAPNAQITGS